VVDTGWSSGLLLVIVPAWRGTSMSPSWLTMTLCRQIPVSTWCEGWCSTHLGGRRFTSGGGRTFLLEEDNRGILFWCSVDKWYTFWQSLDLPSCLWDEFGWAGDDWTNLVGISSSLKSSSKSPSLLDHQSYQSGHHCTITCSLDSSSEWKTIKRSPIGQSKSVHCLFPFFCVSKTNWQIDWLSTISTPAPSDCVRCLPKRTIL
jgi:hypothetical protein